MLVSTVTVFKIRTACYMFDLPKVYDHGRSFELSSLLFSRGGGGVKMLKHTGNLDKQIFFLARSSHAFWFNRNIERKYTINNYKYIQLYTIYFIKNTLLLILILWSYLKQKFYLLLHNLPRFPTWTCNWLFKFYSILWRR